MLRFGAWIGGVAAILLFSVSSGWSAQFIAYQDRAAGVYFASMDGKGHPLGLVIRKREEGFSLYHVFPSPAAAKERWESPYPVAVGVTQGRWCDSADIYKGWAVKQPWCAKTLAQREDIPAWWKAGPDVHVSEVACKPGNCLYSSGCTVSIIAAGHCGGKVVQKELFKVLLGGLLLAWFLPFPCPCGGTVG